MSNEEALEPRDYVYTGNRILSGDKLGICIAVVNPDGSLGPQRVFKDDKAYRSIGGVYRGAEFNSTHARGLTQAKFVRAWGGPETIGWEAVHQESKQAYESARLNAKAAKQSEIDELVRPLRKLIYGPVLGHEARYALRNAVIERLYRNPTKSEREEWGAR